MNNDLKRYITINNEKFKDNVIRKFTVEDKNFKHEEFKIDMCGGKLICEFKCKKKKENKFNKILSGVINDINTNKGDEEISKWLIEMDDANGYSREMNQIMLKYAIYENDSFAKLENLIVDEDISKRPPTWYAKFNDKTMLMIPNRDSFSLEEKYQDWIKKDKEDAQKLVYKDLLITFEYKSKDKNNESIKMKYKGVVFLPEKMRSGFEVGYIDAKLDEYDIKRDKIRAADLYRITDNVVAGYKKCVKNFKKQFLSYFNDLGTFDCESDYMYNAIEGMSSENREGLMNGLKIECGVIVKLVEKNKEIRNNDEEDEEEEEVKTTKIAEEKNSKDSKQTKKKYLRIKGKLAIKALGIIYNHPAVAFERR